MKSPLLAGFLLWISLNQPVLFGQEREDQLTGLRVTPLVKLIQQVEPAVLAIFSRDQQQNAAGSGAVIHSNGFVLTCDHVTRNRSGVVVTADNKILPYRIVARLPEKDLAILQIPCPEPISFISPGISSDLLAGEMILAAGNPGGRGIVFTSGIISSPSLSLSMPSVLVEAQLGGEYRDRAIQFDAASNRGNSGGPLINILGELVGVVAAKNHNEENINFAVPISVFRQRANQVLAPEIRRGLFTGIQLDSSQPIPVMISVVPDSPAADAGLQAGDIVKSVNGTAINDSLDWLLSLTDKRSGETIELEYRRLDNVHKTKFPLAAYPWLQDIEQVPELKNGLQAAVYSGNFKLLPDFESLKNPQIITVSQWQSPEVTAQLQDDFVIRYTGLLKVPDTGAYCFRLGSDDGSRLIINGQKLIDNDGNHPHQWESAWVGLKAGFHQITIDYLETLGQSSLTLEWTRDNNDSESVPMSALFIPEK